MDQGAIASLIMSIVAILLAVLYFVLRQRIYQRALSDVRASLSNEIRLADEHKAQAESAAEKSTSTAKAEAAQTITDAKAEAAQIIRSARQLQDKLEQRQKQLEQLVSMATQIKEDALAAAPCLAEMYADLSYLFDLQDADALIHKDRPAPVAAETVRAHAAEKRNLRVALKQLEYKLSVYNTLCPWLEDLSSVSTDDLHQLTAGPDDVPPIDPVHSLLSSDEWRTLSTAQRNQLALDRYVASHHKTSWQIGRDYELFVGNVYTRKGYQVDYTGSQLRYNDLGRDLIARKGSTTLIIQCKYWSKEKQIHEKHVFQLFGTSICYAIDHPAQSVKCLLVTNTSFSDAAQRFAKKMDVALVDGLDIGTFPRIKCNIGKSGERIYHLPMDLQYDNVSISKPGEFFAMTVAQAEAAGFRRAYKWHDQ